MRWPTISTPFSAASKFEGSPEMGTVNTHASHFFCLTPRHCAGARTRGWHTFAAGRHVREPFEGKRRAGNGRKERKNFCVRVNTRLHGDEKRGPSRPVYAPDLPPSFKRRFEKTRSRHHTSRKRGFFRQRTPLFRSISRQALQERDDG